LHWTIKQEPNNTHKLTQ